MPPTRISSKFNVDIGHFPAHLPSRSPADGSNDLDSLMDLSFDPTYPFGSQTANLEYSMLSAILGNPSPDTASANDIPSPMLEQSPASAQMSTWPGMTPPPIPSSGYPPPLPPELTRPGLVGHSSTSTSATTSTSFLRTLGPSSPSISNESPGMHVDSMPGPSMNMVPGSSSVSTDFPASHDVSSHQIGPERSVAGPSAGQWRSAGDSIYSQVVTGYDYTQGYHFLMRFLSERSAISFPFLSRNKSAMATASSVPFDVPTASTAAIGGDQSHGRESLESTFFHRLHVSSPPFSSASSLPSNDMASGRFFPSQHALSVPSDNTVIDEWPVFSRFEKNDILRVVRALAIFRPSLIALQMPMTEQDEIFVERALQRSLLVCHSILSLAPTRSACF